MINFYAFKCNDGIFENNEDKFFDKLVLYYEKTFDNHDLKNDSEINGDLFYKKTIEIIKKVNIYLHNI